MRPVKLEMSAWGPYPGKICIDFEAVGRNHIFLLAGPTGAGKTTIFDGITYAPVSYTHLSVRGLQRP